MISWPATLLAGLSEAAAARLGLHFPPERWSDLERGVQAAALDAGSDPERYARTLISPAASGRDFELLAAHLTIGETYFFREPRLWEILERDILPELLAAADGRMLLLWSAGCSTGEEPYSLAILLRRLIPDRAAREIGILATDINPRSLQRAREGVYGEWSFRGTPEWTRLRYFSPTPDGRWRIAPEIRDMVEFRPLNLVTGSIPGPAGLILCRNVLMYLTPAGARRAAGMLHRALAPGGWMAVAPAEASPRLLIGFVPSEYQDATLYRKCRTPPPEPNPPQDTAPPAPAPAPAPASEIAPPPKDLLAPARLAADQGRLAEALQCCEKALARDRTRADAHYLKATVLVEMGSLAEAARSLRTAIYLEPDLAIAHFALGSLAWKLGEAKESRKHYENCLRVLATYSNDQIPPESGGLTAGRLRALAAARTDGDTFGNTGDRLPRGDRLGTDSPPAGSVSRGPRSGS